MSYEIVIGLGGLIVMFITIVKPILDLNKNITTLTTSVNDLKDVLDDLKSRVTIHGKEIDNINVKLENHEVRIKSLEK